MNSDVNNTNDKIKLIEQRSKPVEQGLVKTIAQLEHDPLMMMMMMMMTTTIGILLLRGASSRYNAENYQKIYLQKLTCNSSQWGY